jgi:hypothetical protein
MGEQLQADLPTLQSLAGRLRQAGDALDAAGSGAPSAPDAGDVTPDVSAVIGHLVGGAGNLVVGLKEAGDRVDQAREAYRGSDSAAARSLDEIF